MNTRARIIEPPTKDPNWDQRILFVNAPGSFLEHHIETAKEMGMEVAVAKGQMNLEAFAHYGYIWCNWADQLAVQLSQLRHPGKLIVQCRSYEAYGPWPQQMGVQNIDAFVFEAAHVQAEFVGQLPSPPRKVFHLPVGIDLNKWPLKKEEKNDLTIAVVGRHCAPKNTQLVVFLAHELPGFEFHLMGPFADKRLENFFTYHESHLKNLFLYPPANAETWHDGTGVSEFLQDKTFIFSPSYHESTHMALIEGMATGLCPIVWDRPGVWVPDQYIVKNLSEFQDLVEKIYLQPFKYRQIIEETHSLPLFKKCFKKIINEV